MSTIILFERLVINISLIYNAGNGLIKFFDERGELYGSTAAFAMAIRDHDGVSLSVRAGDARLVDLHGVARNSQLRQLRGAHQTQKTRQILRHAVLDQLLDGRGDRYRAGISFRHELVGVRTIHGRYLRRAARIGSIDGVFPRVDVPRHLDLRLG